MRTEHGPVDKGEVQCVATQRQPQGALAPLIGPLYRPLILAPYIGPYIDRRISEGTLGHEETKRIQTES